MKCAIGHLKLADALALSSNANTRSRGRPQAYPHQFPDQDPARRSHRRGGARKLEPLVVCCAGRRAVFGTAAVLMIGRVIRAKLPRPDTFLGV